MGSIMSLLFAVKDVVLYFLTEMFKDKNVNFFFFTDLNKNDFIGWTKFQRDISIYIKCFWIFILQMLHVTPNLLVNNLHFYCEEI